MPVAADRPLTLAAGLGSLFRKLDPRPEGRFPLHSVRLGARYVRPSNVLDLLSHFFGSHAEIRFPETIVTVKF